MRRLLRRLSAAKEPHDRLDGRVCENGRRDALAEIADRKTFERIVEDTLAGGCKPGCLVLVDVDHMQEADDRSEDGVRERILQTVAAALQENFREGDDIGKLEEDLFGLWIEGMSAEKVDGIRRRIAMVNDRLLHRDRALPFVTLSAGVALGEPGGSYRELYIQAEKVLRRVKEGGRCGCEIARNDRRKD